jgi:hypothetical protein
VCRAERHVPPGFGVDANAWRSGSDRTRNRDLRRDRPPGIVKFHGVIPMTPSLWRGGRSLADSDNGRALFAGISSIDAIVPRTGGVSGGVARRRDASRVPQVCPECVRVFNGQTTTKGRFAGTLRKPSDGLEPSTPSLPWRFRGGRHARTHAITRDTVSPANPADPGGGRASRGVARVVSDVSVSCPRVGVSFDNSVLSQRVSVVQRSVPT